MNINKTILVILILIAGFIFYQFTSKPYSKPLPSDYIDDRSNFANTTQFFNDAMDLTKPPDNSGKPFTMSKKNEQQIIIKLEEGINSSKQIDDSFLDYLDPDLKSHYRNEYVKGYELILEGLKGDTSNENSTGVKQQLEGNRLIGEWSKWWDSKKNYITNKAFAE